MLFPDLKSAKCWQLCQYLKCHQTRKCLVCCGLCHVTPVRPDTLILTLLWPLKPAGPTSERAGRMAAACAGFSAVCINMAGYK